VADKGIWVLAGTNGAGKSSIAGEFLRAAGGDYFNPDEAARTLRQLHPKLSQTEANSRAWSENVRLLQLAIDGNQTYFFESTLGGETITRILINAIAKGIAVRIWYAGLATPELHIERVAARVKKGGHDISEDDIRRRYDNSRLNVIRLLPGLAELKAYDNTVEADPASGTAPNPKLVLHWRGGRIIAPRKLHATPEWAKPIVAAAMKLAK
jgi:predicted ABC-type ATPase